MSIAIMIVRLANSASRCFFRPPGYRTALVRPRAARAMPSVTTAPTKRTLLMFDRFANLTDILQKSGAA